MWINKMWFYKILSKIVDVEKYSFGLIDKLVDRLIGIKIVVYILGMGHDFQIFD